MITRYVEAALALTRYERLDDGSWCARVARLRGVIALGRTFEACRSELMEVIEAWVLVRVSRGLRVSRLGRFAIEVPRTA